MLDPYNRNINYLRISVTDRCNLRCQYCMPEEGVKRFRHEDIISFEEIVEVVKVGVSFGINKIRITGGEPLVRKGIVNLVEMLFEINGIEELTMTSNAVLLDKFALPLKNAGLMRINISLDTLDPEKYKEITRGGNIEDVLRGIEAAKNAGLTPIKLNCVVHQSSQEEDAQMVKEFAEKNNFSVRFIHQMQLDKGDFSIVEGGDGGNCAQCNRLRLTANGFIKPCLFSNIGYSIREHDIESVFRKAIAEKPACGTVNTKGDFYNIGG
ncbi:MAG: radical SAM protein [Bacteroidetes bacterium RIFOXYA12_FULL_35_11]|nr:MAG: radical SAM protein [Bacteroidetes bacterium GWF2_35_48]OFY79532.1 MAG: radical SAM protein [Bacteroidetes bacterium RIFOXYA12_FULL_35_11]OFY92726.1 MAG: radical SAM protein [Bacteroidetes bacterium RIFOXYC12_FULL_35_7]HBX53434.1 radical SAM protein [Bacteroidales bacterium]